MAQRMRDYRAEISSKRRQSFSLLHQRSQATIAKPAEGTEEGLEDSFFKSADMVQTFKQQSATSPQQETASRCLQLAPVRLPSAKHLKQTDCLFR